MRELNLKMPRAVVLFSGGLDSMLAIRILQEQGFDVDALNIRTTFDCCKTPAAQAASKLGARLTVLDVEDDYIHLLRRPAHGVGKGMNPCVDCRAYMARMAKRLMEQLNASLVATGEIVGQRPMSQKKQDLDVIERRSGLKGRLLRPLSAKLLPPTIPEQEGLVDREKLYDIMGRGRGRLFELAERYGIEQIPQPSTGCALTEVSFAPRVRDLLSHQPNATRWDFELLNVGRHLRIDERIKIVLGRNESENAALESFARRDDAPDVAYLHPDNFLGPDAVVIGDVETDAIETAGSLILRYSRRYDPQNARVQVDHSSKDSMLLAQPTSTDRFQPL